MGFFRALKITNNYLSDYGLTQYNTELTSFLLTKI